MRGLSPLARASYAATLSLPVLQGTGRLALNILRRVSLARLLLALRAGGRARRVGHGDRLRAGRRARRRHPSRWPTPSTTRWRRPPVQGVSANIQLTNHLLEGANLASGGASGPADLQPARSPAARGGCGSPTGHARLELQAEGGDTQVLFDGHTLQVYDAATNTLYRYTPPAHGSRGRRVRRPKAPRPTTITKFPAWPRSKKRSPTSGEHANVSGATPGDVAGQPAYTVRVSPKEGGSLLGGLELSWDADNGVPLRTAVYSSREQRARSSNWRRAKSPSARSKARCSRSRRRPTPRCRK